MGRVNCPTSRLRREASAESAHWAVNEFELICQVCYVQRVPTSEDLEIRSKEWVYSVNKMNMRPHSTQRRDPVAPVPGEALTESAVVVCVPHIAM